MGLPCNATRAWRLGVGLVLCGLAWVAQAAADDARDASLREEVHRVEVPAAQATIVVTTYRPPGAGPFPWILLSHGSAVTPEANRALGRNRNTPLARQWVQSGYAVIAPIRRGYGSSGGSNFGDDRGSCSQPDFRGAGEGAAIDLLATLAWTRQQKDLDPQRWMLVGQSAGGFASVYTASKKPAGLQAVLAFSAGRGGDPDKRPGEPCAAQGLATVMRDVAGSIQVPVLWFYAENDAYIGPPVQKLWFDSFVAGGGRGKLVVAPPFPHRRGHGVFPAKEGFALWKPVVTEFLQSQRVGLPGLK